MASPRGSSSARGYGHAHRQERHRWKPAVDRGETYCAEPVCIEADRWIKPGTEWDLAHNREAGGYRGPAHATCNRAEGARHRHATTTNPRSWRL